MDDGNIFAEVLDTLALELHWVRRIHSLISCLDTAPIYIYNTIDSNTTFMLTMHTSIIQMCLHTYRVPGPTIL